MQRLRLGLKRAVLTILWPLRRFFDPRFQGVADAARSSVEATLEATTILGRSVAELEGRLDELFASLSASVAEVHREATKASGTYLERLASKETRDLDPVVAPLYDREAGYTGFAAQRGLWFNPPVWIGYEGGDAFVRGVNERIAEVPYVFAAIGGLEPGARILDVGAAESTVALSLASLGFDVTALDIRPYPISHPRLRSIVAAIENWETDERFDAVVCLSTIEHVGLGAYGEKPTDGRADLAAMRRMLEVTKPGGRLLLTTRFGPAATDELQRTYDHSGLDQLLEGWKVNDLTMLRREDDTTWAIADGVGADDSSEAVALVTATRPKPASRRRSS